MIINFRDKRIKITALVIVVAGAALIAWRARISNQSAVNNFSTNKQITIDDSVNELVARGDLFDGVITNLKDVPDIKLVKKFRGVGVYDRNCVRVGTSSSTGNPLVNCHAGINTADYGVLDFNHVHDYYKTPCIVEDEELVVEILDREGKAKVQRVSEISKKALQEGWEMNN